ncbi:MAG: serine/threonine protein kinase [Cellvibrio sp.]|nr:serine/threonine protein kinase [Cellvibrio sp.]
MKKTSMLMCALLLGCGISTANQADVGNRHSDKPKQLKVDWQYSLYSQVSASPVVAGEQLLVAAENGNLYSFNLADRKFNWLYHTEAGIASTPAVVDGRIYFLSRDGFFYALEQATGKRLWRFATGGEARFAAIGGYGLPADMGPVPEPWDFYLSSPLVHNGKIYFGSSDHHLYALDALSGELIWSFDAGDSIHSSPVYANNKIFFGTWGTRLYAVDAETGVEAWHFQGGTDREYSVMQGITAAPAVDGNAVYIGARDGFVYALRQTDGASIWRYDAAGSWVLSTAAIDEKNIYIGTSDTGLFLALDKKTGAEKYRADTRLWTYASPLLVQNRYAFVGTMAGELYGFDKNTGKKLWYYQTPEGRADINDIVDGKTGKLRSEKIFAADKQTQAGVEEVKALGAFVASPVWADNQLIAVSATGEVLLFDFDNLKNNK